MALCSAFLFALGIQFTRVGLRHSDPRTGTLVSIGTATLLYWAVSPWLLERHYWLSPAVLLFAAIGLFRPFLSSNLSMAGTKHLGATISSTLAATSPLFGVALGVVLLGEHLGLDIALGTAAIVAGVVVLSWRDDVSRAWPWWALLLPIGAALLRSVAQAFAKVGMESLPSPYFVGLVGYSVSFLVASIDHGRRGAPLGAILSRYSGWFVLTGASYGLAILSLNSALHCGRLSVVAPIVACAPLFTLVLGVSLFREKAVT
ncbi:MAG: EamA family transporter, partial [Gammaproteobacteria bacterium]|nr:EamA family transporter [Gammaproteobacteria bacterium]